MTTWFTPLADQSLRIFVYAQPGAARTAIAGLHDGALKIRIAAPALEDRANAELIRFLAECFAVPKRNVELLRGDKSRTKQFTITGSQVNPATLIAGAA